MIPVCGVVLAGGRSRRMGTDKAMMRWHGSTMLQTIVATVRAAVPQVIVVAALGQELPQDDAVIVRDPVPDEGPLRGLATGLAAAREAGFVWAVATATDTPLLSAEVVRHLVAEAAGLGTPDTMAERVDAVLAVADGRDQPLIAVYRTELADHAQALLSQGHRGLRDLVAGLVVRRMELSDDASAVNVNTPLDAERARTLLSRRGHILP